MVCSLTAALPPNHGPSILLARQPVALRVDSARVA